MTDDTHDRIVTTGWIILLLLAAIGLVMFSITRSKAEPIPAAVSYQQVHTEFSSRRRIGRGFSCGLYMRQQFGGRYGSSFNLALSWAGLPRTSPTPGAVVVQRRKGRALGGGPGGHVSKIVSVIDACHAIVHDNRGTYRRNICKNLAAYVRP